MKSLLDKVLDTFDRGEGESTIYLGANNQKQIDELNDTIPGLLEYGIHPKIIKVSDEILEIEFIGTERTKERIIIDKWNELDNDSWSNMAAMKRS